MLAAAIVNPGFEQGAVGWQQYSSRGWALIVQANNLPEGVSPRNGNWAAWLGGDNNELSAITQRVTVPWQNPNFMFWYWISSEDDCNHDYAGVMVNNYTLVDSFTLCADKNTNGWERRYVNLTSYAGQSIDLQIRADTDWNNKGSSLFIDDVVLGNE